MKDQENRALGALRGFLTLLVLAHHAVIVYHPYAPPPARSLADFPQIWRAFPVFDPARWSGFAWFVGWNDTFFMSLMFFLSGLFVWKSLQRKGSAAFLRDRGTRLGLGFLLLAGVIAPLAYVPAYLQTGGDPSVAGFFQQVLAQGEWPSGPAWFLWLLLCFDALAAGLFGIASRLGRLPVLGRRGPWAFVAVLVGASALVYLPMIRLVDPSAWTSFGPFQFQTARVFHYAVYFLCGVAVGAAGIEGGLLARGGALARRWFLWANVAGLAFGGLAVAAIWAIMTGNPTAVLVASSAFVLACAALSMAFLALFVRFADSGSPFWASLRRNAYGMYIVHYAVASWLQFGLTGVALPGVVKGLAVTAGTVAISWAAVAAVRFRGRVAYSPA